MSREYQSHDHYRLAYEWLKALDEGQPPEQLAKILGVTKKTVDNWRHNPPPTWTPKPKQLVSQEKLDLAKQYLDEGMSYREIARTIGINRDTIRKYFPGRGWSSAQIIEYATAMGKYHKEMGKDAW